MANKYDIDDKVLEEMAYQGATYKELASHFYVSENWLFTNKKDIIDHGHDAICRKLREEQLRIATDPRHTKQTQMLIFLGKVMLGQRETTEVITTNTDKPSFEIRFIEPEVKKDAD